MFRRRDSKYIFVKYSTSQKQIDKLVAIWLVCSIA